MHDEHVINTKLPPNYLKILGGRDSDSLMARKTGVLHPVELFGQAAKPTQPPAQWVPDLFLGDKLAKAWR